MTQTQPKPPMSGNIAAMLLDDRLIEGTTWPLTTGPLAPRVGKTQKEQANVEMGFDRGRYGSVRIRRAVGAICLKEIANYQ